MPAPRHCSRCDYRTADTAISYCPKCGASLRAPVQFYDAFVSYRREGGSELAELVRLSLQTQYGMNLFVDVNELRAGAFDEKLLAIIENAPCFLLILSKGSLDRCQNEGDWLRREIAHALNHGKRIVPVLAKGFVMPPIESLPEDIRRLTSMNGVPYDHQFREAAISKIGGFIRDGRSGPAVPAAAIPRRKRSWVFASVLLAAVILVGASYFWGVYVPEQQRLAAESQRRESEQERLSAETTGRHERERREADRRAAARGGLIVRTKPSGAEVRVGVVALEKAPLTMKDQRLGKYPVQIRLEGYDDWVGEVELKENEFTELDIVLQRSTGTLTLTSVPAGLAAEIKGANDEPRSVKTPANLELPTGEYLVTFHRDGWMEQTQTVVVKRKATTATTAEFSPGSVAVTSEPTDCSYIMTGPGDLSRKGKTPKTEEQLPTGDYTVKLRATGYREAECKITVKPKSTADAHLTLERESADDIFRKAMACRNGTGVPKDEAQAVNLLRQAADMVHAGAQNQLGIAYYNGQGVTKDLVQAAAWFMKAANLGYAEAKNTLGTMYADGQGVAQNLGEALAWYRKAADQGDALAQYNLGDVYENGRGVAKDLAQAVAWYQKAAAQGHAGAQNQLGNHYDEGIGVAKDPVQALAWYKKAADQGEVAAQYNLGRMYDGGRGVAKDPVQAVDWYQKSAVRGYALAQYNLGCMYENGRGVAEDFETAVVWYKKAADQGNAHAQFQLGVSYHSGRGVAEDSVQAAIWYRKAAMQGYALAQFNLGWMYQSGQGVPNDPVQAVAWFRKAADQGLAIAQFNLSKMYETGQGVAKDTVQTVAWLRKAADQGYSDAQFNLGVMYAKGLGVPKDISQAVAWYKKAAAQGNQRAIDALRVTHF